MKRIFTFLIAVSFTMAGWSQQYTMLSKQTADWCPRCGQWGWEFVKKAQEEMKDENIIYWGLHFDGGLATETSKAIVSNFNTGYQPVFFLNQDDLNVSSGNIDAKVEEAKQTVQLLNSFPSSIEVDVEASIIGTTVTADVKVSFSEGTETDYNLGVYLVRDNVVAFQSGQGGSAVHPNLLDAAFHEDPWGPLLNDGNTINSGDDFESTFTLTDVVNHSNDINDLKVVAVVWFNVLDEYTFVNGEIKSVVNGTSNISDLSNIDFNYSYNQGEILVNTTQPLSNNAKLSLIRIDGQRLPINVNKIDNHTMNVSVQGLSAGTYILNVRDGSMQGSKKIFIVE